VGEPARNAPEILAAGARDIILYDDPDTCAFAFDGTLAPRKGWLIPFEALSVDSIRAFQDAGANYFVSSYVAGIDRRSDVYDWLDVHARRLSSEFPIYDLTLLPQ
jgi:hypothetical protein